MQETIKECKVNKLRSFDNEKVMDDDLPQPASTVAATTAATIPATAAIPAAGPTGCAPARTSCASAACASAGCTVEGQGPRRAAQEGHRLQGMGGPERRRNPEWL